ncbi:EXS family-domain-containing protein [Gigaspora rosea]|uniref:EXS family-domain-containing protein n=1 Tax=Gigaspora rosea TaxID=44941 RepID=A0A397VIA9_9GLOM|nr:EXS family-domain-containing protein [Gigaspora rosea]
MSIWVWVIFSGFDSDVYFCDKILADIMTSHAKVFGDLYVTMCILFIYNEDPMVDKYYSYIPYFIRFKQCIAVYLHSKDPKNTGREHLFNALKYCSAFPVISYWITPSTIFNLWIIAVAVNSIYSFYRDVAIDWKLSFFTPPGFKLCLGFEKSIAIILTFCFDLHVTRRWIWIFFKFESESAEINKDPYIPLHNTSS